VSDLCLLVIIITISFGLDEKVYPAADFYGAFFD